MKNVSSKQRKGKAAYEQCWQSELERFKAHLAPSAHCWQGNFHLSPMACNVKDTNVLKRDNESSQNLILINDVRKKMLSIRSHVQLNPNYIFLEVSCIDFGGIFLVTLFSIVP